MESVCPLGSADLAAGCVTWDRAGRRDGQQSRQPGETPAVKRSTTGAKWIVRLFPLYNFSMKILLPFDIQSSKISVYDAGQ